MTDTKPLSPYQFAVFRWLLGTYLTFHMLHLIPWGAEIFSSEGVFPDASSSPLAGLFPNLLALVDSPLAVQLFLVSLAGAAVLFAVGYARPWMSLVLWYGWTCLFNRNLLISNPGLPYIGLILVLCALVPKGEGLSVGAFTARADWAMPAWVWRAAFFVLMAGYTYSGVAKLSSPSWLNGEATELLATNPLARDWWVRDWLLALPQPLLKGATWFALAGEIAALPLSLFRRSRALAWLWMFVMHLGVALAVDFLDLTLGMVLVHLFVFDPSWLPPARAGLRRIVFFDGVCALCDGSVRFLIGEDRGRLLRFAPLQGATAAAEPRLAEAREGGEELRSVVYLRGEEDDTEVYTRSDAVLRVLEDLGGFWRLLAIVRWVPRFLRDALYDFVARNRYRWFGKFETCRLPQADESELFLD